MLEQKVCGCIREESGSLQKSNVMLCISAQLEIHHWSTVIGTESTKNPAPNSLQCRIESWLKAALECESGTIHSVKPEASQPHL